MSIIYGSLKVFEDANPQISQKIRADERAKVLDNAEKLLDKIAPDKVAEIKCDDGEIRNRPLIDIAKVYEIFEQMKGGAK